MKSKNPNRKIFSDAVDLFGGAEEDSSKDGIVSLPIESIHPFKNHPFRLYEGQRLDDMVESIKENGILTPVMVRKDEDGYENAGGTQSAEGGKNGRIKRHSGCCKERPDGRGCLYPDCKKYRHIDM